MLFKKNRLLRFLAVNLAFGAGAACVAVGAIFLFDVGGIGSLAAAAGSRWLAAIILSIAMTITWGSVAMGTAVFLLPKEKGGDDRGCRVPDRVLVPAPVKTLR